MQSLIQRGLWTLLVAGLLAVSVAYLASGKAPPVLARLQDFALTNQVGNRVDLASLRGRVSVVNVIFSRCPTQCRRLSAQMQRIQARIPSGVRLLTMTADPEHDSPEVLARYGLEYQASPQTWWFLTGRKAEVYRVAVSDLKFAVVESGDPAAKLEDLFIHSADFGILDAQGRLRFIVHGEDSDAEDQVLRSVKRLKGIL
ncbi:MAG: SCO family protein [Verrucomicrobiota bacterium]